MDFSEVTPKGVDKVSRYDWQTKDTPGEFRWIDKALIRIDPSYQRSDITHQKIATFTRSWSWLACGVITIADRSGEFWAVDGQHRVMAALRRSDITELPCLVFPTVGPQQEAQGFLDVNESRRPISARNKHKAKVCAGDPIAVYVQEQFERLGISLTANCKSPQHFKCLSWAMKVASESRETFCAVMETASEICQRDQEHISQPLVSGLAYLHRFHAGGITEKRMSERIRVKGPLALTVAAKRSALIAAGGGAKVWAKGILDELNKGLAKKFVVEGINDG
jgi:hypothetical protein